MKAELVLFPVGGKVGVIRPEINQLELYIYGAPIIHVVRKE